LDSIEQRFLSPIREEHLELSKASNDELNMLSCREDAINEQVNYSDSNEAPALLVG
jgi:hypothetical protein